MATPTRSWRYAALLVLAACGLLFAVSASASGGGDLRSSDAEVTDLVREADERHQVLSDAHDSLSEDIDRLTERSGSAVLDAERAKVDELNQVAGMVAVEGPGLQVTLSDADIPAEPAPGFQLDNYIVHQQDIDAVMNALWAGGAEAMMVMDQRIISTSSVQCIGSVLQIDGRQYAPPYVITAIGPPDRMLAALDGSADVSLYRAQADVIGLVYEVVPGEFTLPAFEGSVGVSPEIAA